MNISLTITFEVRKGSIMMNDFKSKDLNLSGVEIAQGGNYKAVVISENAKINGNCNCDSAIFMGYSPECGVNGNVKADFLKVHGMAEIYGNVNAELLKIWGGISVKGDCEAEAMSIKGGVTVDGLLNAENINIQMFWPCRVNEIGGGQIRIKRLPQLLNDLKNIFKYFKSDSFPILEAEVIEGDIVYLEYTKARIVRGNNVTIGPGCEIGMVEYKESIRQDESAVINDLLKI